MTRLYKIQLYLPEYNRWEDSAINESEGPDDDFCAGFDKEKADEAYDYMAGPGYQYRVVPFTGDNDSTLQDPV